MGACSTKPKDSDYRLSTVDAYETNDYDVTFEPSDTPQMQKQKKQMRQQLVHDIIKADDIMKPPPADEDEDEDENEEVGTAPSPVHGALKLRRMGRHSSTLKDTSTSDVQMATDWKSTHAPWPVNARSLEVASLLCAGFYFILIGNLPEKCKIFY